MKSASPPQIAIVEYGMGNVRSVQNALEKLGSRAVITADPAALAAADGLVLPGVGAFGLAMENLRGRGLVECLNRQVLEREQPILGICLGMQLFAERSFEMGEYEGLGWIPGRVEKIDSLSRLQVPHVGWNETTPGAENPLYRNIPADSHFYFDHSYHFACEPGFTASTVSYGHDLVAAVRKKNIFGVQFHPEKSQSAGLRILRNYLNFVGGGC